ncbi:MAG: hypothetical protein ACFFCS_11300 [Candidatus Hodarchaeota archaeon]
MNRLKFEIGRKVSPRFLISVEKWCLIGVYQGPRDPMVRWTAFLIVNPSM